MGKKYGQDLPIGQSIALERDVCGDRVIFAEVHRVSRNKYRWRLLGAETRGYTTTLVSAYRAARVAVGR